MVRVVNVIVKRSKSPSKSPLLEGVDKKYIMCKIISSCTWGVGEVVLLKPQEKEKEMKKVLLGLVACSVFSFSSVQAGVINPSFETGDLTGWLGSASVVTTATAANGDIYGPTDGNYFAVIDAGAQSTTLTSDPFLGLAGQTLAFDWLFNSEDYLPYNDYGSFSLMFGATSIMSGILANVADTGDYGNTGWLTEALFLPYGGMYTLSFSSTNLLDAELSSQLYVDNIRAVPEAGSLALMGLGLLGLAFTCRQKRINANKLPA